MKCTVCGSEWSEELTDCPVCNRSINDDSPTEAKWEVIGFVEDQLTADFARETLIGQDIPAVVFSRSGMFGKAGLTFTSFYNPDTPAYEISVPAPQVEDAVEVLDAILSGKWRRKE